MSKIKNYLMIIYTFLSMKLMRFVIFFCGTINFVQQTKMLSFQIFFSIYNICDHSLFRREQFFHYMLDTFLYILPYSNWVNFLILFVVSRFIKLDPRAIRSKIIYATFYYELCLFAVGRVRVTRHEQYPLHLDFSTDLLRRIYAFLVQ